MCNIQPKLSHLFLPRLCETKKKICAPLRTPTVSPNLQQCLGLVQQWPPTCCIDSPTSSLCPWIPDLRGAGYLHNLCVMDMPATLSLQRVSIYEALCHERALHLKMHRLQHDLTWKWMEIRRKLNGTSFYWMEIWLNIQWKQTKQCKELKCPEMNGLGGS